MMENIYVCLFSLSCVLFFSCEGQVSTIVDVASDIRLVGGINQYEGRVEVYRSGEWQTVCDDSWDIKETEVVCRQLEYGYAIMAIDGAAFGQGSGGQWNRVWSCNGNESSLDSCSSTSVFCSHSEDASVVCSDSALSNGALRLVDTGSTQFGGRLEFYYNGTWGTVCDDGWGTFDAAVACRQMGFLGVSNSDSPLFGFGVSAQTIWLDEVVCSGSESRLIDCSHAAIGNEDCMHSEDVGIVCTNVGEASDIRLVGGRNQYEGRVEVYRHRQWQTVCDDSWDILEAEVVCRQLGYGYAILAIDGAAFGQGSGEQWSRVWSCNGNEGSLDSCNSGTASCSHSEDASVICSSSALSNGALRLVNTGSTRFGGRLEFYYDSKWGTVCDDGWDSTDAAVACRQMGFLGVSNSDSSQFGSGTSSQTIWLDNVVCSGSESRLIDCPHADLGNDICVHSEDVGIVCTNEIAINIAAIIGGVVSAVVVLCLFSMAIWICICVCCCYAKKGRKKTATSTDTMTTVSQTTAQDEQQSTQPPEYNPIYDPTLQGAYAPDPAAYTQPTAPVAAGGSLPPTYPAPGGTLPAGYAPQQPYPTQPTDMPPPYPGAPPFTEPN